MSMINKIIKALKSNDLISDYSLLETNSSTFEMFYDLHLLETQRETNTSEVNVTIYVTKCLDGVKKIGSSSFIVSHVLSKKELEDKINDAIYAAKFVENEYYELVSGEKKKSYKQHPFALSNYELLSKIANIYFSSSNELCKFNSLELFLKEENIHLINSLGVDYKKIVYKVNVEAIPSYKDGVIKTELYRMNSYDEIDFNKIKEDSENAINDVMLRAKAKQSTLKCDSDIILSEKAIRDLMFEIISSYNYADVYRSRNIHKIGDMIQENPKCLLNISLIPSSKADYFDADGVSLKEALIIQNGVVNDYYGSNRFAYYLKKIPNGFLNVIKVGKGKMNEKTLKKNPYIEIIDLSGIQLDLYSDYIGGEVRLAKYFDGENCYPISGFSFSGSLQDAINNLDLSASTVKIKGYVGPKYALIKNMKIM